MFDFQIGDIITWTHIPKKTTKNIEDLPEYVRQHNIKMHGKGPFTALNIMPHPFHKERIVLVEIQDKNGNKVHIGALAFKKIKYKK